MLKVIVRWLLTSLLVMGSAVVTHAANAAPDKQRWVPGQILVEPKAGVGAAKFEAMLERH